MWVNLSSIAVDCNCQRNSCTSTCSDICLECAVRPQTITYLIPTTPTAPSSASPLQAASGDNNFGDAMALNGIALAKSDPWSTLTSSNNIAPLDQYGGHSTLQYTYHCAPKPAPHHPHSRPLTPLVPLHKYVQMVGTFVLIVCDLIF